MSDPKPLSAYRRRARSLVIAALTAAVLLLPVAIWFGGAQVQQRVALDTQDYLQGTEGGSRLLVGIGGRFANVTGTAPSAAEVERLERELRGLPGLIRTQGLIEILPVVNPYSFETVRTSDGRAFLTGYMPNDELRFHFVSLARSLFGRENVQTDVRLAGDVPDRDWFIMVEKGMRAVADLIEGRARLSGRALSVSGTAENFDSAKAVQTALVDNVPQAYRNKGLLDIGWLTARAQNLVQSHEFSLIKDDTGQVLTRITVPDRAASLLLTRAFAASGVDERRISFVRRTRPAPAGWYDVVGLLIAALPSLPTAEISLRTGTGDAPAELQLTATGAAGVLQALEQSLRKAAAATGDAYRLTLDLRAVE